MNPIWQNYLLSAQAVFNTPTAITFPTLPTTEQRLFPLVHLGVLTISGKDAATLLQGQITCNINGITDGQSSLGAICNPQGRAIATFLLLKQAEVFHLVVPVDVLETVKKRLGLFILRSIVTLTDNTGAYCLLGITSAPAETWLATSQGSVINVNLGNRAFILAEPDAAIAFWSAHIQQGFQAASTNDWQLRDMDAGIPWLSRATSAAFVPQMFNLDKLGGISFNKGCYTGQEIIARTHYLGKSKRGMILAETVGIAPEPNTRVVDGQNETAGHVLAAHACGQGCKLLIVVQLADNNSYALKLADGRLLTVSPFSKHLSSF